MSADHIQQDLRRARLALAQHEQTLTDLKDIRQKLVQSLDAQPSTDGKLEHNSSGTGQYDAVVRDMWQALRTAQTRMYSQERENGIRAMLDAGAAREDELRREIEAQKARVLELAARLRQ
ncbi:hypothetical protein Slin15195_G038800 [Septoria linicola]|uniref:Uncharacterized protein n=1 Tax=Septoria linicola TaxID=215465 RepID=A0A9Q9ATQ3_9PEZI|nr:hypothetical protein Slin14017_G120210 [Septoria linicola]USW50561.1 hypothetical protein Slin15195_G038800 [Septoria linicola]